jgi:hypothetical protein
MKKPNGCNERGRITGMPGTQTSVTLYPQTLGVRMRNNIIRMLESRAITGGGTSQSRKLAEAVAGKYNLQCSVVNNYRGLRIVGISETAAPLVSEVVNADWVAWLLENPEYRTGYYRSQYEQTIRSLEKCDSNFYCNLQEKGSNRKVIEILAEHTTPEMKEKAQQVADLLRGTGPIHLITF